METPSKLDSCDEPGAISNHVLRKVLSFPSPGTRPEPKPSIQTWKLWFQFGQKCCIWQVLAFCLPQMLPSIDIISIYTLSSRNFEFCCKTKPNNKKNPIVIKGVVLLMLKWLKKKCGGEAAVFWYKIVRSRSYHTARVIRSDTQLPEFLSSCMVKTCAESTHFIGLPVKSIRKVFSEKYFLVGTFGKVSCLLFK